MHNTEDEILKADPFALKEGDKHVQRHRHRNNTLEKFYAGKSDEKYTQKYYEILKKADEFVKTATPHKVAIAADKHGSNFAKKDKNGRRHEHLGFFDPKHKHADKTLGEVLDMEMVERRTTDDNYKLISIINNNPIEVGLANIMDVIEGEEEGSMTMKDIDNKSKQFEFPINGFRNSNTDDVVNKIEQLTEFLHIKEIGMGQLQYEFFIPLKYKTVDLKKDSNVYKDLTNINGIFVKEKYEGTSWFAINEFKKRIVHNDTHEVWMFYGIQMEVINTK
jgi:hypothetical protein